MTCQGLFSEKKNVTLVHLTYERVLILTVTSFLANSEDKFVIFFPENRI